MIDFPISPIEWILQSLEFFTVVMENQAVFSFLLLLMGPKHLNVIFFLGRLDYSIVPSSEMGGFP